MTNLSYLHIVVLLWLCCYQKAVAFRALPVWGGLDRTAALHRTAPVARTNRIDRRESSTQLYGIPKLFRWLVDLYPLVLESVGEGLSNNAMSVDHFYLDMNGIIHTCTHSNNDKLIPLKEQEMFLRIFAYTDRLYKLVNPKKSMFLAVDGVAPRAKMNQQRSRRFRSSKEREALIADHLAKEGKMPEDESFDSNCITPGTPFMYRLSVAFRKWIEYKMKTDKFWQNGAEVIFSGPDVPGEGEHKVMDLIRAEQKKAAMQGQDRHCLYGLDADLVMLSLVTHEPHFVLLREKIATRRDQGNVKKKSVLEYTQEDFECLEITILRRMLKQHFRKLNAELDNKSAFGAAAVGTAGSPMVDGVRANDHNEPARASPRTAAAVGKTKGASAQTLQFPLAEAQNPQWTVGFDLERIIDDFVFMCMFVGNDFLPCLPHMDIADGSLNLMMNTYRDILPGLGGYLTQKNSLHLPRVELYLQELARREPLYFQQRAMDEKEPAYAGPGYRDFYYQSKFGIAPGDEAAIRAVAQSYLQGLYWVLTYYHHGCGSWTWYYPHLYAPLASDLVNLAGCEVKFEVGRPFTPLMQLLSVLPPQSGGFLPPSYEMIMSDPESSMVEYYPQDFEVDANGKRNAWECIVRIPFINESLLMDSVNKIDHLNVLTDAERLRNAPGVVHRFVPKAPLSDASAAGTGSVGSGSGGQGAAGMAGTDGRAQQGWGNALGDERRSGPPRAYGNAGKYPR